MPDWITESLPYVWYAERWHWTPDQVDALPLPLADDLPLLVGAIDEGKQRKYDREMRAAEHNARAGR